ncbi:uncharacterized protein [Pseudorasbora parva]|uniref:uncharacterized protein n=1 Tax=Pseudorasbora parva TaxID=51549 RepID=UPI00351E3E07
MALVSSLLRQLFDCFAHFLRRRDAPQQCVEQESAAVEKLPEEREAFDGTANDRKRRRKCKNCPLGEREEEREVKISKGGSHKEEAEITQRGRVHQKKREVHSLEKLMERGSELQVDPPKLLAVPSCSDEVVSLQRSSSQMLPVVVPPRPTPAPDEMFSIRRSSSQVRHPKRLPPSPTPAHDEVVALQRPPSRKPLPFACSPFEPLSPTPAHDEVVALQRPPSQKPLPFACSPFEPAPELMLVDIEDDESEYVVFAGKTFWASDLVKSERPQMPELEKKPRLMVAWMEKDCEVQEEVWADEVLEVQDFVEVEGDRSEMGDAHAIQGHLDDAFQIDERVDSPEGPQNETQDNATVQKTCKRKGPLVLFTWAVKKAKKIQEKKLLKEKERQEKELLLERYINEPKLKHLWINKHNHNYCSS